MTQEVGEASMVKLSPKDSLMEKTRADILKYLPDMDLSEQEAEIVRHYADRAAQIAGESLERQQQESPANRIAAVLRKDLGSFDKIIAQSQKYGANFPPEVARAVGRACHATRLMERVASWRQSVKDLTTTCQAQGKTISPEEAVKTLLQPVTSPEGEKIRIDGQGLMIEVLDDDSTWQSSSDVNSVLSKLGFLPEEGSLSGLFSSLSLKPGRATPEQMRQYIWGGELAQVIAQVTGRRNIVGLRSDSMPGVAVAAEHTWPTDSHETRGGSSPDMLVHFYFDANAIARSVVATPAP